VVTDAGGKVVGIISDRDLLRAVARTQDWHSCYIRDVMTANPVTIDAETPISVAATKMLMNRFNSLPVVEGNGRVLGIITSTDVLSSSEKMVKELMHLRQR
jgi:CBS domain-containing protein